MRKLKAAIVILSTVGFIAGCDMTVPSQIRTGKIQLQQGQVTEVVNVNEIDRNRVAILAGDYQRNGEGAISMTVAYPAGDRKQQLAIEKKGNQFKEAFRRHRVNELDINYIAVEDMVYAGRAIISYSSIRAKPPSGCRDMPGMMGAESIETVEGYELGCEIKSSLSKMIADPRDLMGVSGTPEGSSRRQGAAVETYKDGAPNEKIIENMMASDLGQ